MYLFILIYSVYFFIFYKKYLTFYYYCEFSKIKKIYDINYVLGLSYWAYYPGSCLMYVVHLFYGLTDRHLKLQVCGL